MSNDLLNQLETRLAALTPESLIVEDESHLHAGHAGNRDGAWEPTDERRPRISREMSYGILTKSKRPQH